jgi:hypothetical protein
VPSGGKDAGSAGKKERLLAFLGKLNDRDTQRNARDSLVDLLKVRGRHLLRFKARLCSKAPSTAYVYAQDKAWLDADALPMVVHSLCATGPEHKPFARKVRPQARSCCDLRIGYLLSMGFT